MAWTPRSDTGGGKWAVYFRVLARRATKTSAQQQAERPGATLTATLDAAVLSGQGILVVASPIAFGTVDYILGAATVAGTGSILLSGSTAATLVSATVSATSVLRLSASASNTLSNASVSATGAVRIVGSLTKTLGTATLVASNLSGLNQPTLSASSAAGAAPLVLQFSWTPPSGESPIGYYLQLQVDGNSDFSSPEQNIVYQITSEDFSTLSSDINLQTPSGTYYARLRFIRENETGTTAITGYDPSGNSVSFDGDVSAWSSTQTDTISSSVAVFFSGSAGVDRSSFMTITNSGHTAQGTASVGTMVRAKPQAATNQAWVDFTFDVITALGSTDRMGFSIEDGTSNLNGGGNEPGYGNAVGHTIRFSSGTDILEFTGAGFTGSSVASGAGLYQAADVWRVWIDKSAHQLKIYRNRSGGGFTQIGVTKTLATLSAYYITFNAWDQHKVTADFTNWA